MHELSIAISMIDVAEEESLKHQACTLDAIHVQVGARSGVVPEALAAAYELAREHTSLSNCRLVIERMPGAELLLRALEFAS